MRLFSPGLVLVVGAARFFPQGCGGAGTSVGFDDERHAVLESLDRLPRLPAAVMGRLDLPTQPKVERCCPGCGLPSV